MEHYPVDVWIDFVRGLTPPTVNIEIERHLRSGCARCGDALHAIRALAHALEPRDAQPPEAAVRSVKTLFRLEHRVEPTRTEAAAMELIFDSALSPALVGSREAGGGGRDRQYLYESEEYSLDVRCDRDSHERPIVVGQLLERSGHPVVGAPAYLWLDGSIRAAAITREFGSFHLEGPAEPPYELWLVPTADRRLAVEIDGWPPAG